MERSGLPEEPPLINIKGDRVSLGPQRRDLLPVYLKWMNDFEVTRTLSAAMKPLTWEAEVEWWDRVHARPDQVLFTIYERTTLRPIGNTGLDHVDHLHRTADFGIVIGEKDCWGKGYGTEATALVLDYGFTALGLHNIMLSVDSFNERGIRAYLRAGFSIIGRRREAYCLGGRAYDVIFMDCLSTGFERVGANPVVPGAEQHPGVRPGANDAPVHG